MTANNHPRRNRPHRACFNDRELAMVLACLRAYQESTGLPAHLMAIATRGGELASLSDPEIDKLCERLNYL